MDYLLRTTTESEMEDALIAAGIAERIDGRLIPEQGISIDHIGAIKTDVRWHTNLRVTFNLTAAQVALLPTFTPLPTIPYRVFA
jgi:hypothetical protein